MSSPGSPRALPGWLIARVHTVLALTAFASALFIGCMLHYKKIVKNGVAGWPKEWFPSVSATIGDWYPERNIFQIMIALTSGPRFALVYLLYCLNRSNALFVIGILRTLSCGGWVYITSTDDHDIHDVCMITYVVLTLPWMIGGTLRSSGKARRWRRTVASAFFASLLPLGYFFYQHKVKRIPGASLRSLATFVSDLYLAHTFWAVFTAVQPTLFYFSVWELAIAGPELAILSVLSPTLLGSRTIASWASSKKGQAALHVLSLAGLLSYLSSSPVQRLFLVTPSTSFVTLRQAALLVQPRRQGRAYYSVVWLLGLILFSLGKYANHSNSPVWPFVNEATGGYNKTGILFAVFCCVELVLRHPTTSDAPPPTPRTAGTPKAHWVFGALPLGALTFILHAYLTEPGTLAAWAWTGWNDYKPSGPLPHHAVLTLLAMAFGAALAVSSLRDEGSDTSSNAQRFTQNLIASLLTHPIWHILGSVASLVMYRYRGWTGYAGSLVAAIYWTSLVPSIISRATATGKPGRTLGLAMFVYILFILASVWTVAYAFVPGGIYLRERTDLVMIAQTALLASTLAFSFPKDRAQLPTLSLLAPARLRAYFTLALLCILGLVTSLYRQPTAAPRPYNAGPRIVTAGIWTVHFGFDNAGRDSQRLIAQLPDDMRLDVFGLLETDLHRTVFGNRDLSRYMAEEKGYFVDIGPGPNKHTWGAVLLSKFPIKNSTHHLLPSPHGELAPAITAILDVWGTDVMVVVSHNGQKEDRLDRQLQSTELGRLMAEAYPMPTIFLGYVVTRPHAKKPNPYRYLVEDGQMYDIDEEDKDRWCEYILYRGLYRTAYARVSRGVVTDTEMQIGQFVVPKHGETTGNLSFEDRYLRSYREDLPVEHWFPDEYYGNKHEGGKNKHFYHVFDTPLYYRLPEGARV
ncbi:Frag1/DRAM/Sfk1 family-domain-containing protein [Schizophyllum commune]